MLVVWITYRFVSVLIIENRTEHFCKICLLPFKMEKDMNQRPVYSMQL